MLPLRAATAPGGSSVRCGSVVACVLDPGGRLHAGKKYTPALGLTASTGGSLTGSFQEDPDLFRGDLRIYPVAIDKRLTLTGTDGWDKSILVPPGEHVVTIGVAIGRKRFGFGDVRINVTQQSIYTLRAMRHGDWAAYAWIEQQGGAVAGEKVLVQLSEGRPLTPVFIPVK